MSKSFNEHFKMCEKLVKCVSNGKKNQHSIRGEMWVKHTLTEHYQCHLGKTLRQIQHWVKWSIHQKDKNFILIICDLNIVIVQTFIYK